MLNQKLPLVSIIIPVYNVQEYVEKCLRSLTEQTYKNIELIIVNDGSTDKSLEKILKFSDDTRIKLFTKDNKGLASARNYGVEHAQGDYIWHVDSDDYAEIDCLEKMVNIILNTDSDIVVTGYYVENVQYQKIKTVTSRFDGILQGLDALELMLKRNVGGEVWTKLYKRKLFQENNILQDERYSEAEDIMVNVQLFKVANQVIFSDILSIHHLVRSGSYSDSAKSRNFRIKHHLGLVSMVEHVASNDSILLALNDYISYDFISVLRLKDKEILGELGLDNRKMINSYLNNFKYSRSSSIFSVIFLYLCSKRWSSYIMSTIISIYIKYLFK